MMASWVRTETQAKMSIDINTIWVRSGRNWWSVPFCLVPLPTRCQRLPTAY